MTNLPDLDVSFVSSLDMVKGHHPKFTIFEEIDQGKIVLPSLCVESTIEEILEYMGLGAKDSNQPMT